MSCDYDQPETEDEDVKEDDEEVPRQYKTLHAKLGKGNRSGRSGGSVPPEKDSSVFVAVLQEEGKGDILYQPDHHAELA